MTWALGFESLDDFFSSAAGKHFDKSIFVWKEELFKLRFLDDADVFEDFSATLDFLDFSREDVDELDEYELSEPESLESDEPEPEELDRRLRLSVEALRAGDA